MIEELCFVLSSHIENHQLRNGLDPLELSVVTNTGKKIGAWRRHSSVVIIMIARD